MSDPSPAVAAPKAERVFTWPLLGFLLVVAAVVGAGLLSRVSRPDLAGAVLLLGDGDLDGDERRPMLVHARQLAVSSDGDFAHWVALLASLELGEAEGYRAAVQALAGAPWQRLPSAPERRFLHLGNSMLGNVLDAAVAEGAGARATALAKWRQVAAQASLTARPLAAEQAAIAIRRLQ